MLCFVRVDGRGRGVDAYVTVGCLNVMTSFKFWKCVNIRYGLRGQSSLNLYCTCSFVLLECGDSRVVSKGLMSSKSVSEGLRPTGWAWQLYLGQACLKVALRFPCSADHTNLV